LSHPVHFYRSHKYYIRKNWA